MDIKDVRVDNSDNFTLSLSKLCGNRKIKDIEGHITGEFGDYTFQMGKIVFEDGSELWCEGEHDCPYVIEITSDPDDYIMPNDDILENIYEQQGS